MQLKLNLRGKIYLGFASIVLLLSLTGLFGWLGIKSLEQSFSEYRSIEAANTQVLRVDRDVQELKHRVNQYISTGQETYQHAVSNLVEELKLQITGLLPRSETPEMESRLDLMMAHLEDYHRGFGLAVEERALRTTLVQESLPQQGARVEALLNRLSVEMTDQDATEDKLLLISARRFFGDGQKGFLRYFEKPDSVFVNEALAALASAQENLDNIQFADASERGELIRPLLENLGEYRRIGLRAVQATRGYLYLVAVVMAGEASEFDYNSSRLKALAETRRRQLSEETMTASHDTNRMISLAIAAAIIAASLLSARLAFLIIEPITTMTSTFRDLAAGRTTVTIPGTSRADELGEMASAAEVFRRQNAKTKEILAESQRLGEELKDKAEELQRSNEELDRFAYVASHDLKSPLRGINQLAEWIQEDAAEELPAESAVHLQMLQRRVQKMETLLQDLLDYSRVGRAAVDPEEIDSDKMLDELVELLDNPKGVKIIKPDDLPKLVAARAPLQQVFLNLLTNAIKHHHRGEAGTIEITWRERGDHLEFSVQDDGPGIAAKDHDRIFQMYQRVGDSSVDGSGMGLAIVKKQIERHFGEISLCSAAGEGARFTFTWPANEAVSQSHEERIGV